MCLGQEHLTAKETQEWRRHNTHQHETSFQVSNQTHRPLQATVTPIGTLLTIEPTGFQPLFMSGTHSPTSVQVSAFQLHDGMKSS